jgi:hypothetical protein
MALNVRLRSLGAATKEKLIDGRRVVRPLTRPTHRFTPPETSFRYID